MTGALGDGNDLFCCVSGSKSAFQDDRNGRFRLSRTAASTTTTCRGRDNAVLEVVSGKACGMQSQWEGLQKRSVASTMTGRALGQRRFCRMNCFSGNLAYTSCTAYLWPTLPYAACLGGADAGTSWTKGECEMTNSAPCRVSEVRSAAVNWARECVC